MERMHDSRESYGGFHCCVEVTEVLGGAGRCWAVLPARMLVSMAPCTIRLYPKVAYSWGVHGIKRFYLFRGFSNIKSSYKIFNRFIALSTSCSC